MLGKKRRGVLRRVFQGGHGTDGSAGADRAFFPDGRKFREYVAGEEFLLDYAGAFWQKYLRNGGVAQLGERLNGIQEAKSSILFISTRI